MQRHNKYERSTSLIWRSTLRMHERCEYAREVWVMSISMTQQVLEHSAKKSAPINHALSFRKFSRARTNMVLMSVPWWVSPTPSAAESVKCWSDRPPSVIKFLQVMQKHGTQSFSISVFVKCRCSSVICVEIWRVYVFIRRDSVAQMCVWKLFRVGFGLLGMRFAIPYHLHTITFFPSSVPHKFLL
jgi:hypothetical protein